MRPNDERSYIDDNVMIQKDSFYVTLVTFELKGKSGFTLATLTHTAYKPCVQTLTAIVTSRVSCLCRLTEIVVCRIWTSWLGWGWETEDRRENRWLIIVIIAGIKCRYYIMEYSGYFKSPQRLKMLLYDCKWHYS